MGGGWSRAKGQGAERMEGENEGEKEGETDG